MRRMEASAEGYTKLVIRLIDRCFESEGEILNTTVIEMPEKGNLSFDDLIYKY